MRLVYVPILILGLVAAGYTWLWFDAAARIEREFLDWAEDQRERGLTVRYDSLEVGGFPLRMHMVLENPELESQGGDVSWTWRGAQLSAHALPYRITHVIVMASGPQQATIRARTGDGTVVERLQGTAESARASLVWTDGLFDRLAVDIRALDGTRVSRFEALDGALAPERTETLTMERLQLHSVRGETSDDPALQIAVPVEERVPDDAEDDEERPGATAVGPARRIAVKANGIVWGNHIIPGLGDAIEDARLRLLITGIPERLVRRRGVEHEDTLRAWRENGGKLYLENATVDWAPMDLAAQGAVKLDRRGRPRGRIDVETNRPEGLVDALEDGDVVGEEVAELLRGAIALLGPLARNQAGAMSLPVKFKDGRVYVSTVSVGRTGSFFENGR